MPRKSTLTPDCLRAIKSALEAGATQEEVAARFGKTQGYISHLKRRNFRLPSISEFNQDGGCFYYKKLTRFRE